MRLVNYMQDAVGQALEGLLLEPAYRDLHLTEKARLDILAIALNHLPSRYVVTDKGHVFARTNELRHQFKTDSVVELTKAIKHVISHPR